MTGQMADPFPADALEVNRDGRLTDAQRTLWTRAERAWRKNELVGVLVFAAIGVVLLTASGPASATTTRLLAGVGALVVAGFFVYRSMPGVDPLEQDLRNGRVESVEGALGKRTHTTTVRGSTSASYYFDVAGRSFEVWSAAYRAAPEAGIVRVFFLPRSHKVVNLERLADRPLPAGALDSPMPAVATLATALGSHDPTQRAEAMATFEAMKDAMEQRATPPPADQRDQRPLAEAIVGTWHYGPMSWSFAADGTATGTLPNGRTQQGRWSVGTDGKLKMTGLGAEQDADAWIAGDTLTVVFGGRATDFQRAAG